MQRSTRLWISLTLCAAAVTVGLAFQRRGLAGREVELDVARTQRAEQARLQTELERLNAARPSAAELAALRADRVTLKSFRAELGQLRESSKAPAPLRATARVEPLSDSDAAVPAANWTNAGRSTPQTTLETALWAAVAGEVDVLAQTLTLEPETRARAEALLRSLPPAAREQFATPERFIALMTAKDIPLGSMRVIGASDAPDGARLLRVRLQAPDGSARTTTVIARGGAGEWRLVVPPLAVDKYAAQLKR